MSKISELSIHLAQQHAIATYERGLRLVALSKSFKRDSNFCVRECGHFIEQQGLLVQQYARESLTFAEQISTCAFSSTYLYSQAVCARAKAIKLYSQAVTVYTQVTQGKYKAAKIRLHLPDRTELY
jgi:hypothetical protein